MTVLKISKLQGFVWKTMQAWLDGRSCFSHTNASNFRRPLQSLLLRYTVRLKILRLPYSNMLFQLVLTKFFKSEPVFAFTESWSRDQVMQRAYWDLFSDGPLRGSILMKCILGDRLRAVPLFVLLAEFGKFHQLCLSCIPLLYHF